MGPRVYLEFACVVISESTLTKRDMLLDKLHWLPKDIIKRRFPIYVGLSATLFLISCGFGARVIYFLILGKYFLH